MPHYYFNLADGVTQRDRTGIDCIDDAAAVVKASIIATKVTAANGNNPVQTFTFPLSTKMGMKYHVSLSRWSRAPTAVNTSLK